MRTGIIILNLAAGIWLLAALSALPPLWSRAAAPVLSVLIAAICLARVRRSPPPPPDTAKAMGRTVGIWSTVQAVLIVIAVVVLVRSGETELIAPVVAIIVGLHFIPIAHGIGLPLYYLTAMAFCLIGVGTLVLGLRPALAFTGTGAAIVLYLTAIALTR